MGSRMAAFWVAAASSGLGQSTFEARSLKNLITEETGVGSAALGPTCPAPVGGLCFQHPDIKLRREKLVHPCPGCFGSSVDTFLGFAVVLISCEVLSFPLLLVDLYMLMLFLWAKSKHCFPSFSWVGI